MFGAFLLPLGHFLLALGLVVSLARQRSSLLPSVRGTARLTLTLGRFCSPDVRYDRRFFSEDDPRERGRLNSEDLYECSVVRDE